MEGESHSIQVSGMQFSYDANTPLFFDFNLTISPGSRCLLVGANGSGAHFFFVAGLLFNLDFVCVNIWRVLVRENDFTEDIGGEAYGGRERCGKSAELFGFSRYKSRLQW